MKEIKNSVVSQREFAKTQPLISVSKRIEVLNKLKSVINNNHGNICRALKADLGKSEFESFISEIDFTIHEINFTVKRIKKWSKPEKVKSSLTFFPVKSYIYSEPYGTVLILAPWNYPFQLLMAPLIGAIAAGNTVILKPSEVSSATSNLVANLINENFDSRLIRIIEGAIPETTELLDQKFDYIFYTGSGNVGKIVLEKAAKFLTPVTLELGGKSPCLVYSENLDLSAKRIMWGKFFNAGQTCVAPDYVLISSKDKLQFIESCKRWLEIFYGNEIKSSQDYGRIINEKHFKRLEKYLGDCKILAGGECDLQTKYIEPTIVSASLQDPIMQEEIFGPILPIIEVDGLGEAIEFVNSMDKPLASYAFLDDENQKRRVISEISSGGMVINDTIIHLSNERLPFGGVGASGMGSYHGKFSFDLFSHKKSVMKRSFFLENNLRYPPYENKLWLIRKIMSFFG